ncbi:MAG: serine/threonine protein kinase, partial [Myxococcota bacterium]|nr:serine/threonine protein kinase [Myxococcota bacterium]
MVAPGTRIGRYEIGARLGTGGFGVVYLARDTELGRELAIKVLRPEYQMQPDVVGRFLKEARAAAKIDHPGIVTVFECGHITGTGTGADGNAFIAMELLRGESLATVLERRGRLSVEEAVLIARQIAAALGVAHAAGIVHRDLKPDNVFLIPDVLVRGGARVKVLDFGVAKLAEPKDAVNTHSQMMLGTPMYMSPEQGRSAANVDHRTDIYTLGCMLYEMLTGRPPYEGPGAIDLIIAHTTAPVPSPAAIVADLPRALDALIIEMLAKDPAARPASMLALEAALEQVMLEPKPPARPRPPTPTPPQPPARPSAGLVAPPVRPSVPVALQALQVPIAAPARPSAPALAPTLVPRGPSYSDELDGKTFTHMPQADRSRTARRLLLATGLGVASLAAAITWFA